MPARESPLTGGPARGRLDAAVQQRSRPLNRVLAPSALEGRTSDPSPAPPYSVPELVGLILAKLDDDKAQEIILIDLKERSSVADAMIVASGRSHRHVGAIADRLLRALKDEGYGRARVEGLPHCDWVLIDAGDVIVHLFRPEVRAFYNLEKIWADPPARATTH